MSDDFGQQDDQPDNFGLQVIDLGAGSGPEWLFPLLGGLAFAALIVLIVLEKAS